MEGTIRILHDGSYGTICDDSFDSNDAKVICRMLGYHGPAVALSNAHFGQGSGQIWLDDLACTGTESDVAYCGSITWGKQNCQHSEDAGVRCSTHADHYYRLIGGKGNYEGTVDILENGQWGSICDKYFTNEDATTVCRAMGFKNGIPVKGAKFGQLTYGTIWTEKLGCYGNETAVWQCRYFDGFWGQSTSCNHSMDAGVTCEHTPVRLVGGTLPSEGRLEVQHNGVWGTVCGNSFTQQDGDVICRMLGFNHSAVSIQYNITGGSGPIWLGDLNCQGDEMDLEFCNHAGWNNHTCTHAEDVGLKCRPTDVRLTHGSTPSEGTVEIYVEGSWRTICDNDFGDKEADVVCRMLGYTGRGESHIVYHSDFFGHSSSPYFDKVTCHGDESDISQCAPVFHSTCSSSNIVGLRCEGAQVRLVDGPHSTEGRVEVFHGGQWGSVCDAKWDDTDATVICRMLAFYPYDREVIGKAIPGSYFGQGDGPVWLSDVKCNGTENDLSECAVDWSGGVNCDHSRDAGVFCEFPEKKRLQGGQLDSEGSVEFNYGGTWHPYCDDGWNVSDAKVVCRELGYWTANSTLYFSSHFGGATSTVYKVDPQCSGREGNFEMCYMGIKLGTETCSSTKAIGVDCAPQDLDKSELRLVDGPGPWKGRLEIKSNGVWGSVCYDYWNDTYTDIVCRNLRFLVSNGTSFQAPRGLASMHYKSFDCPDGVTNLGQCRADFNITDCSHTTSQAVGIDCSDGLSVTLNGGDYMEGKLELHTLNDNGRWSVCRSGLNNVSAKVICSMAGYSNAKPNVTSIASQDPILYTDIACDGWESHVTQCSTMNTGQTCDDKAYINCFSGCIRNHTMTTGTIVSVNYPQYTANMDCLDIIKNPGNSMMKLTFNDLDLSGDGDFIEIKDGPHGRQLGYYAANTVIPSMATDKDFYIRLKTNSAGNARGFNVSLTPLNVEDTVSMICGPSGWRVAVNLTLLRKLFPDTGVSQIKLSDQLCTGKVMGDTVIFEQHYTECSTTHKVNEGNIIYYNELVYPEASSPFPIVIRGYRWTVELECDVARTETVVNNFHPNHSVAVHHNPHITNTAHYNLDVKFFSDGTFYKEINGKPLSLKTGEDVYVMVKMTSDDVNIKMRVDSCYAKPDQNAGPSLTFPLIQNGCVVDTYTRLLSQGNHETRFVFTAFEFPLSRDSVYVFCNATYCDVTDHTNKCTQVCHGTPAIVGRAIGSWGYKKNENK